MSYYLSALVGVVLLFSGLLKALHVQPFVVHLARFGILSTRVVPLVALLCIEIECALGMALILGAYPVETVLAAGIILGGLSIATAWGVLTNRIEHCGCYGGVIWLPPGVSLGFNGLYLLLLALAFQNQAESAITPLWKVLLILLTIGGSGFLSKHSIKKPLLDMTLLRAGRKWRTSWLIDEISFDGKGKTLLLFFRKKCSECKGWISILNQIADNRSEMKIFGIISAYEAPMCMDTTTFRILYMKSSLFSFLIYRVPTLILLENGVIRVKWTGKFPDEILNLMP